MLRYRCVVNLGVEKSVLSVLGDILLGIAAACSICLGGGGNGSCGLLSKDANRGRS